MNKLKLTPPYIGAALLAIFFIFNMEVSAQNGQKYSVNGNNLSNGDFIGSKNYQPFIIKTNNSEAARFTTAGFLGLGTPTPSARLHIVGSFLFNDGNQQNGYVLTTDANGNATWQDFPNNFANLWQQSGNNIYYNTGFVGIGTNTPTSTLDVNGNASIGGELFISTRLNVANTFSVTADSMKVASGMAIMLGDASVGGAMAIGLPNPGVALDVNGDFNLTGSATIEDTLSLPVLANYTSNQLLMVTSTGSVVPAPLSLPEASLTCSISVAPWKLDGQNSPTIKLCDFDNMQVNGFGYFGGKGLFKDRLTVGFNQFETTAQLNVQMPDGVNNIVAQFQDAAKNRVFIVPYLSGSGYSQLSQQGDIGIFWKTETQNNNLNAGMVFAPHDGLAGMRITNDGKVGIGISAPAYALDVKGMIRSCDLLVEGNNWCDYVFAEDYPLLTLKQVEGYIKENNHLPGVPSAGEMAENGLQLGDAARMTMEKVEELTLYIIELSKRMEQLEKENKALQAQLNK
jgi:hypothetical protein